MSPLSYAADASRDLFNGNYGNAVVAAGTGPDDRTGRADGLVGDALLPPGHPMMT